jgi:hypothetical protein
MGNTAEDRVKDGRLSQKGKIESQKTVGHEKNVGKRKTPG